MPFDYAAANAARETHMNRAAGSQLDADNERYRAEAARRARDGITQQNHLERAAYHDEQRAQHERFACDMQHQIDAARLNDERARQEAERQARVDQERESQQQAEREARESQERESERRLEIERLAAEARAAKEREESELDRIAAVVRAREKELREAAERIARHNRNRGRDR